MRRRAFLSVAVVGIMVVVVAISAQKPKPGSLLLLDWAAKGKHPTPPIAVLVELGVKDTAPTDWSGKATVTGAKLVHREGYRFRKGDELTAPDGWKASSRRPIAVPRGNPVAARQEGIATVGIVLHLSDVAEDAKIAIDPPAEGAGVEKQAVVTLKDVLAGKPASIWDGKAVMRLISTATSVADGKTEDDFPAACYAPDGTLWVAWIGYTLKDEARRTQKEPVESQPKSFKDYNQPGFGDQLFVRYYRSGKWSKPATVGGATEDLVRCAVAAEKDGAVWVVYSANRKGNFDIYARKLDLNTPEAVSHPAPRIGEEERVTDGAGPDLAPVACTDQEGKVHVRFQSFGRSPEHQAFGTGSAVIESGKVTDKTWRRSPRTGNYWNSAVAAAPDGRVAMAFDYCSNEGDYDISIVPSPPTGLV